MSDLNEAALELCRALDSRSIQYAIGGSFASSVHGIARATQGLDIVAALTLSQAGPLADLLKQSFYADLGQILDALHQRRSFNVIHLATVFKLDIFQPVLILWAPRRLSAASFQIRLCSAGIPVTLPVISAEDILLAQTPLVQDGGGTSERQWNDLSSILQIQQDGLDCDYLNQWAAVLEVQDLLLKLLNE
jgi:hypothetical protein